MGAQFSSQEYKDKLIKFKNEYLSLEHTSELDQFLQNSDDYANCFTSISLDDFRSIKELKPDNIVHIVSHVSILRRFYLTEPFRPSKPCTTLPPTKRC